MRRSFFILVNPKIRSAASVMPVLRPGSKHTRKLKDYMAGMLYTLVTR